jgi:peroxiredoxin
MKSQTKLIVLVTALAIAAGAAFGIVRRTEPPQAQFVALAGGNFSTADLRGRVVLVNFWATSCVTCVEEMPKMVEAWNKYAPRGYEMVAVAMSYDHPNAVAEFVRKRALPFRVALDASGEVARVFGNVNVTPTSYLLDRSGRIVAKYVGEPDWQDFHARVERALAEPA